MHATITFTWWWIMMNVLHKFFIMNKILPHWNAMLTMVGSKNANCCLGSIAIDCCPKCLFKNKLNSRRATMKDTNYQWNHFSCWSRYTLIAILLFHQCLRPIAQCNKLPTMTTTKIPKTTQSTMLSNGNSSIHIQSLNGKYTNLCTTC